MSNISIFNPAQVPAFAQGGELSETAKALMGGTISTSRRISIKGGVFRIVAGGKEIASIEERHLDVIVIKAAPKVSRIFYAKSYDGDNITGPDCWSNDGDKPDASIKAPQSMTCMTCPQNIAGSGQGNSRACRYQQRLAVMLADNPDDVLQLTLPATSVFGKEDGDKRPLQAYVRHLGLASPPVDVEKIVTRMKFDTKAESPKLFFSPVRWLTPVEFELSKAKGHTQEALDAVRMTPSQTDGVKAKAPIVPVMPALTGKPLIDEDGVIEEAPKPKKAKAEPVADVEDEPEVRKEVAKPSAVPAKKGKLADIVADWDDE
jgi:hypothetical protein